LRECHALRSAGFAALRGRGCDRWFISPLFFPNQWSPSYREGDVPVARGYLKRHAEGNEDFFKALLQVWAAEMPDEKLRKEAQALLFGLR